MKGPVTVCDDTIFKKIIGTLEPILMSAQDAVKVSVPLLPRYVFHSCCNNPQHCPNLMNEEHAEKMLNGVSHLRAVFKTEAKKMGIRNHWILDGTGTLAGVRIGSSGGSNRELVPELRNSLANDGVHLSTDGYRKLAQSIKEAIEGIRSGSLTKSFANADSVSGKNPTVAREYFWRGFSSPVGDEEGRSSHRNRRMHGRPGWKPPHFHPYKKR
jgi:hypothetical protein